MSMTNKKFRAFVCTLLTMLLALTLFCFPADVSALGISKTSVTLTKGYSTTLKVTGTSGTVKWSTSDSSVASVSSAGKVVGRKVGTATITANVSGTKLTCKVKVVGGKLAVSSKNVTLDQGSSKYITVRALGSHGLKVTRSNTNVVSAAWVKPWKGDDIRLKLTAKSPGTSTVKVYLTSYPDVYININVTVEGDDEASLLTNVSAVTAKTGSTASIIAYTNKDYSLGYSIGDSKVASISEGAWKNGTVTLTVKGLSAGNTTLKIYRKDNTSVYKNITIAITGEAGGYYTVLTESPTKQNYSDQVIRWVNPKTGHYNYMLVPSSYDSAKVNTAICKYNGKFEYYQVFDESPVRQSSTDTIKTFSATVNNTSVTRYVLVPAGGDQAEYDTAVAEYTKTFSYWTIYNVDPSSNKIFSSDLVKTWTKTINYKSVTRYILVPGIYDETKLNNIIAADSGSIAGGYYGVSTSKPSLKNSTDQVLSFNAQVVNNGITYTATYYVLVPQNYDEAKYNDAVASINGYEYYTIYTVKPTKKLSVDEIQNWTKLVDSKAVTRYVLLPPGYNSAYLQTIKNNDLATQTSVYYTVSTTYPTAISNTDIVWYWKNPSTNTYKYMLLPANYSTLKRNDIQSQDTGLYEYYHIYSTTPKTIAADDQILKSQNASGTIYMLVPKNYDQTKVNQGMSGIDVSA